MPVDATGNYVMNPSQGKSAPPATDASAPAGAKITIDPATMTMTVAGNSTTYSSAQELCDALEQELGPSDQDVSEQAGM